LIDGSTGPSLRFKLYMSQSFQPGRNGGSRAVSPDDAARGALADTLGRPLNNLRLSVTDRCNLRCRYCMPDEDYVWLPREELLTFEEIGTLVSVFTDLGVTRVRLTGGEPLLRRDLPVLVWMLAANPRLRDLALTTNGVLLAQQAAALRAAGLGRVTISLDTLQPKRFEELVRRDAHADVLKGIDAAQQAGFQGTKIDAVILRGFNDDEIADLLEFGLAHEAEVRFIEYMDVGGATDWSAAQVFSRREMLAALEKRYGHIEPLVSQSAEASSAPAERFRLADGTIFGIIASTTAPFCRHCDRSRLTADGLWYLCLYASSGTDLRRLLRSGAPQGEIAYTISRIWASRTDRGAEERAAQPARGVLVAIEQLRQDPHLEMHTRGG
jgi:cyclic pyranopterin phosphate synthase